MTDETTRDMQGRWRKGASGNPAGRSKNAQDMASLARRYTKLALDTLRRIAADHDAPTGARVLACRELLDRGHGRTVTADVMQLVSQGKSGVRSTVEIEFVRAKDGRPWTYDDLPTNLPALDNVKPQGTS